MLRCVESSTYLSISPHIHPRLVYLHRPVSVSVIATCCDKSANKSGCCQDPSELWPLMANKYRLAGQRLTAGHRVEAADRVCRILHGVEEASQLRLKIIKLEFLIGVKGLKRNGKSGPNHKLIDEDICNVAVRVY